MVIERFPSYVRRWKRVTSFVYPPEDSKSLGVYWLRKIMTKAMIWP